MDLPPLALAKLIITQIPNVIRISLTNRLGWSPCSDKQDPRTEIVVAIIRSMLTGSRPLGQVQASGLKDPGIKGPLWIATAKCPAPDNEVRDAVIRGIKELGDGSEKFDLPSTADVEGEWTGHRASANGDKKAPRPSLNSEQDHYDNLMAETTSDTTILYFHGGAYFLMDPISHRALTSSLAKRTGGRCFSVRYRLAPQTAFPGQLLDALTAYLYLLSPPPGSFHKPVPAHNIVFAGDSAGGHLCFSLLLLILTLRRNGVTSIRFHGVDVPLSLPAGVAANSPWLDICRSLPSITGNAKYDYLDPPSATGLPNNPLPADDIWPTSPPRAEIFCNASSMTHPLASPLSATSEMWAGAPPVWMCCGTEGLQDEDVVLARRLWGAGVRVEFVGYEGMPHCFAMIFPTSERGKECIGRWAGFAKQVVEQKGESGSGKGVRSDEGVWCVAKSSPFEWRRVRLAEEGVSDEAVRQRMEEMKGYAVEREAEMVRGEGRINGRANL